MKHNQQPTKSLLHYQIEMEKASQMAHTNKVRYYEKSRCAGKLFSFKTTTSEIGKHYDTN